MEPGTVVARAPPLPCACASGVAVTPKASSSAGIKVLKFYFQVKLRGRLNAGAGLRRQ
jgi:hypothetical protein